MFRLVLYTSFLIHFTPNGFSQKGSYLGTTLNGFPSRYYLEVSFLKLKQSGFGFSVSAEAGQYGQRIFDKKTKDWFGRVYNPKNGIGENYYQTDNKGFQGKFCYFYRFDFSNFVKLDVGFFGILGIYRQKSEFDIMAFDTTGNYVLQIMKERFIRLNCALGFETKFIWKINKKWQFVTGLTFPFYLLNPNKFNISKEFDPPLLGAEPALTIGIRYKLKTRK
ncbi:hypothetical protein [Fluviicola sp.]|uniref:hypothetical protein n=1 Tax=Fluviicola sp. TaxID=1917219 RepID=UPI0026332BA2|nr:hypothetical protein [Fluviicola sp.]